MNPGCGLALAAAPVPALFLVVVAGVGAVTAAAIRPACGLAERRGTGGAGSAADANRFSRSRTRAQSIHAARTADAARDLAERRRQLSADRRSAHEVTVRDTSSPARSSSPSPRGDTTSAVCQNWEQSQAKPEDVRVLDVSREEVLAGTEEKKCVGLCYTYTEPVAYLDDLRAIADEARTRGLRNFVRSRSHCRSA